MNDRITDQTRISHILDAMTEVEHYLEGISFEQFLASSEKRFATIKQLEIIGEASNQITDKLKAAYPGIEWKSIRSFRNISIHEYFGVNLKIVWEIAQNDLPILKEQFLKILDEL
ncbi:MAG: DUF86 domain-containing protein [Cytophagales bacterium]|nr:DUF86 domain-containing protein [Cytophagales bacterium]